MQRFHPNELNGALQVIDLTDSDIENIQGAVEAESDDDIVWSAEEGVDFPMPKK